MSYKISRNLLRNLIRRDLHDDIFLQKYGYILNSGSQIGLQCSKDKSLETTMLKIQN